jgi:hypothetical protein
MAEEELIALLETPPLDASVRVEVLDRTSIIRTDSEHFADLHELGVGAAD